MDYIIRLLPWVVSREAFGRDKDAVFLSLAAASRILSSPFNASSCLCVQVADDSSEIPLGHRPSLQNLRHGVGSRHIVRLLLRYCADVRLLSSVHVRITATGLPQPTRRNIFRRVLLRSPGSRT
jgi:hypothetical protein